MININLKYLIIGVISLSILIVTGALLYSYIQIKPFKPNKSPIINNPGINQASDNARFTKPGPNIATGGGLPKPPDIRK